MRFTKEQLAFKALVVLSEAAEQCHVAPIRPSVGIRFALAYLYAVSERHDRAFHDTFWEVVQDAQQAAYSHEMGNYLRYTQAWSTMRGVARAAGIELTAEMEQRLRDMHHGSRDKRAA
jgi:hypothetical protein